MQFVRGQMSEDVELGMLAFEDVCRACGVLPPFLGYVHLVGHGDGGAIRW